MTVPTQPVTIRLADFGGDSVAGITVTARPSDVDYTPDGTFVSMDPVSGVTDVNGQVVLNLFPNALSPSGLGTVGTTVQVTANLPNSRYLNVDAVIPNEPCSLASCIVSQEPIGLSGSELAAAEAIAARNLAKKWATQTSAEVEAGQGYGAKKYALDAAADRLQTGLDRTQTGLDRIQTGADRTQTGLDAASALASKNAAAASQSAAANSEGIALGAAGAAGSYANSAGSNVPRGLTQASVGAITPGAGGTNGTFALGWSGGNFSVNPTATFTVAGGVLTAVTITGPGLYIGAAPTVPTPSFAASAGLAGAAVALTAQFLIESGKGYWVQSADGQQLLHYRNASGVATADPSVGPLSVFPYVENTRRAGLGGMGNSYVLGAEATIGDISPDTSTVVLTTDPYGPAAAVPSRSFVKDWSCRLSAAGDGYIVFLAPDDNCQFGWKLLHQSALLAHPGGVRTFQIAEHGYPYPVPAGTRVHWKRNSGGALRYVASGTSKSLQPSGVALVAGQQIAGSVVDFPGAATFAVSFTVIPIADSLETRVSAMENGENTRSLNLQAMLGEKEIAATLETFSNIGLPVSGTLTGGLFTWGVGPMPYDSIIENIVVPMLNPSGKAANTTEASTFLITQRQEDGTQKITTKMPLRLAVAVSNTVDRFKALFLPKDSYLWLTDLVAGTVQHTQDIAAVSGVSGTNGPHVLGGTITPTLTQTAPMISWTLRKVALSQAQRNASVDKYRGSRRNAPLSKVVFSGASAPVGVTQAGGWTFSGNRAVAPAAGSWTAAVVDSLNHSALDKKKLAWLVTINDVTAVHGPIMDAQSSFGGCAVLIEPAVPRLAMYERNSAGGNNLRDTVALPAGFVTAGHRYLVELEVDHFNLIYRATDIFDPTKTVSKTFDGVGAVLPLNYVRGHGNPGYMLLSGAGGAAPVEVEWWQMDAPYYRNPHTLFLGDSNSECAYLTSAGLPWTTQIANLFSDPKDCVIATRAGDHAGFFNSLRRNSDLKKFQPTYIVIASYGTNNGATEHWRWRREMRELIDWCDYNGGEVILGTLDPRADRQAFLTNANTDMLGGYYGRRRTVDLSAAVTVNGDRVNWIDDYRHEPAPNTVHANQLGNNAKATRFKLEAAYAIA